MLWAVYTGSKPPSLWMKIIGTIIMISLMIVYSAWGLIKLAFPRPHRETPQ